MIPNIWKNKNVPNHQPEKIVQLIELNGPWFRKRMQPVKLPEGKKNTIQTCTTRGTRGSTSTSTSITIIAMSATNTTIISTTTNTTTPVYNY